MKKESFFAPLSRESFDLATSEVPNDLPGDDQLAYIEHRGSAAMNFLKEVVGVLAAREIEARIVQDGHELFFEHPGDINPIALMGDTAHDLRIIIASLQELAAQLEVYPRFGLRFMAFQKEYEEEETE